MLSRLSAKAREKVRCIDTGKYGITKEQYGKIYAIGTYHTAGKYDGDYVGGLYCELFVNDKRQTIARYLFIPKRLSRPASAERATER
ncbi:MAG: hypothetical protein MJ125_06535, partial [Clostridia bacterium]|nr:hypothetical protein [Clostridia bacterium]